MTDWLDRYGNPVDISRDPVERRPKAGDSIMVIHTYPCPRCGGSGIMRPWGTCFNCNGAGTATPGAFWFYTKEGLERVDKAKAKREDRAAAKREATKIEARALWAEKDPELLAALDKEAAEYHEAEDNTVAYPDFVFSVLHRIDAGKELTEKMDSGIRRFLAGREKFKKAVAEREAKDAAITNPIPADLFNKRSTFAGEILTTKRVGNDYGMTVKMLLRDDRGFKLWGTVPGALFAGKGDKIRFDAMLGASNDDPAFGFFSRPTKAELTKEAKHVIEN